MRGAVLPHVTSQHYVFSYKINERSSSKVKGQGQRSRSAKINIISKIPYYWSRLLLLFEIFDFRKVYWSPRFVCLLVCVSVCLSVCPSSKALQAAPLVRSSWFFLQKMSSRHATMQNFFFWQSDEGQGQGHHFCENQIMAITFEPEVTETSGCLQNVPYIIPLLSGTLRFDVRRHVFRSRDFKKISENHIMGHNFWTGSGRDLWLADKCSL